MSGQASERDEEHRARKRVLLGLLLTVAVVAFSAFKFVIFTRQPYYHPRDGS